jgi:PAS domain S-box-containing protein
MRNHRTFVSSLVFVVGLGLSAATAWHAYDRERHAILEEFEMHVEDRLRSLEREIDLNLEVLFSLEALHRVSQAMDRGRFRVVARQALERHSGIQALEWAPRVTAVERAGYEESARHDGHRDFHITDVDGRGRRTAAGERSEYFPVYFVEPLEGNEEALGLDLASDPIRRAALERSRDTGVIHATAGITLVQEREGQQGFLVCLPVYRGQPGSAADRRATLEGFMVGVYRIADIFDAALGVAEGTWGDIDISLTDDADGNRTLYRRDGTTGAPATPGVEHRSRLAVAGRDWTVVASPAAGYFAVRRSWMPQIGFAVGLLLTGILAAYVHVSASRARAVERLVEARTRDLRDANERLEQQRGVLQSILDNLGDGVAVADEAGRLSLFNPAAEQILGVSRVDSGPESWSEVYGLLDPETQTPIPFHQLPLARAVAGEASRDVELLVRNPERPGGVFIRVTATPLKDRMGRPGGGVAVFRDIGERKWAEAVLRDSEARFRAIVEATSSALIILSPDHRVREFNPQAERVFGIGRAAALGQDFLQLCLPAEYQEAAAADIRRVLNGERTPGFEIPVPGRDAAETTLLWSFSRLAESRDRETVVIATGHDITERRQAEDARRVRELAAHLQSAREAERSHVAREIHDELGQALTGLKLEVSYLSRRAGEQDPQMRERLTRLGRMIDDSIVSVRRIAADLRPQILDELGLYEAIRWQAEEFEQRTRIHCTVDLPDARLDWNADRATAMFRILQEALTNVARHADATQASVRVTTANERVILEVSDNGRGIGDDQTRSSVSFGLIGMRERARMFGGKLEIRSGPPAGTTVTASMPY